MSEPDKSKRPWMAAVKAFLDSGFRPGGLLTDEWLCEKMGLAAPGAWEEMTHREWQEIRPRLRVYRRRFVSWLCRHGGFAFDRVPPRLDEDGKVQKSGLRFVGRLHLLQHLLRNTRDMRRGMKWQSDRIAQELACVDLTLLSETQKAELKQTQAEFAAFEGLLIELRQLRRCIGADLRRPREEWGVAYMARSEEVLNFLARVKDWIK